jgi:hypothetical protein
MNSAIAITLVLFLIVIAVILVYYLITYKRTMREFENAVDDEKNVKIRARTENH